MRYFYLILFSSQNAAIGWDGTYKGIPMDIGTYQYQLSYVAADTGKMRLLKGAVTLVR